MNPDNKIEAENRSSHLWIIALIIVVSFALSLLFLIHDPINYLELNALHISNSYRPTQSLFKLGSNDDPMPLFYLILNWYNHLFNKGSIYLDRLLSLICYELLIIVVYFIGRIVSKKSFSGIIAASFIALSPFMIWYGNRLSVYSMLTLAVAINQLCFIGIYSNKKWALMFYPITCIFGLGLHFIFLAIIIPQIIYLIITRSKIKDYRFIVALSSALLSLAAFGIWLYLSLLKHSLLWSHIPLSAKPSATNTFIIFFRYLFGFQSVVVTTLVISLWPLLVILSLLAVQKYSRPSEGVKYLFVSAVFPVLILFMISWVWKPLFFSDYLIIGLPAFLVFIAWYLTSYSQRFLTLTRYSLIMFMVIMLIVEINNYGLALREDYLGAIRNKPTKDPPVALITKRR